MPSSSSSTTSPTIKPRHRRLPRSLFPVLNVVLHALTASAQTQLPTQSAPGQPQSTATSVGTFSIVGQSIASAQQMFLGTLNSVYIIDKTENNPTQINGHPAWAAEYKLNSNTARPMDVVTNTFCAGGNVLGNGTWINVGGNQAVTYGGLTAASQTGGGPFDDLDGGFSLRFINPCDDSSCEWIVDPAIVMQDRRWYPTVEGMIDGSVLIIGGDKTGGFLNSGPNNNPTYEFYPSVPPFNPNVPSGPISSTVLTNTLPANLFPLTWLLPNELVLIQTNRATVLLNLTDFTETPMQDMPGAVRTYPASGGSAVLPLTPANNWQPTMLFCGGQDFENSQWNEGWDIAGAPASPSCVTLTPSNASATYVDTDPLPLGRTMISLINLPDGTILGLNGGHLGVAGYGNDSWAIGQSYADGPTLTPLIYDPSKPAGSMWNTAGSNSTIARMYHSSAVLVPDGSVLVSGSNPNADYNVGSGVTYPTEYRVETFYPSYYNSKRPQPQGLPSQLGYGGEWFNVTLSKDDLAVGGSSVTQQQALDSAKVVIIRSGFSTHALSMGQKYLQLNSTYTGNSDGSGVLHVSQMPANPALFTPGPALMFVVVSDIPSVGVQVMIGSGNIEVQSTNSVADLPSSQILSASSSDGGSSSNGSGQNNNSKSGAISTLRTPSLGSLWTSAVFALCVTLTSWMS